MITVGERISELMRQANIGENELARKAKVPQSTVHRIKSGATKSPRHDNLVAIGRALGGYSVAQLMGEIPLEPGPAEPARTPFDDYTLVPRYNVTAGLGDGELFRSEQVIDELAFRTSWLRNKHLQPDQVAVIACRGDSMTPTIRDGDIALVDLRGRDLKRDGIYAIRRDRNGDDSEIVVKRLQTTMSGALRIISDNEDYLPEEYPAGQVPEIAVVGRVVWAGGDVR